MLRQVGGKFKNKAVFTKQGSVTVLSSNGTVHHANSI